MSYENTKRIHQWGKLSAAVARGMSPKFPGEIYEWASRIELRNGYAIKGHFDVSRTNYMRAPFESLKSTTARVVVVQAK